MNIRKFKWIFAFAGAIAVVLLLRGFAFTSCLIPSTGMENSLFQGERILVNKWSYGLRVPLMSLFSYHRWCERSVRQQEISVDYRPQYGRQINLHETNGTDCIAGIHRQFHPCGPGRYRSGRPYLYTNRRGGRSGRWTLDIHGRNERGRRYS